LPGAVQPRNRQFLGEAFRKKQQMKMFELVVDNVGIIYSGGVLKEALTEYGTWVRLSKAGYGQVAGETVTLLKDGEPWMCHQGEKNASVGASPHLSAISSVRRT
jgi:hypothetical protein